MIATVRNAHRPVAQASFDQQHGCYCPGAVRRRPIAICNEALPHASKDISLTWGKFLVAGDVQNGKRLRQGVALRQVKFQFRRNVQQARQIIDGKAELLSGRHGARERLPL